MLIYFFLITLQRKRNMLPFLRKNNYWKIECLDFSLLEDTTIRYVPIGKDVERHPYFINVNDEKKSSSPQILSSKNINESVLIANRNYICHVKYFITHFELNIYRPYFVKKLSGFRSLFINIFGFELGLLECHRLIDTYGKNIYSCAEIKNTKLWKNYCDGITKMMKILSESCDLMSSIGIDYILEEKYSLGRYWLESKENLSEDEKLILQSIIGYGLK